MLILVLFSALIVFTITTKFLKIAEQGTADAICEANIIGAWSIHNKNYKTGWSKVLGATVGEGSAETLLQNPMCNTKVRVFDYRDYNGDEEFIVNDFGNELGEMIESCWSTFGEGKLVNTFGQEPVQLRSGDFSSDKKTYYFPCYKFKVQLAKNSDSIDLRPIASLKDGGYLWTHTLKGTSIDSKYVTKENDIYKFKDEDAMKQYVLDLYDGKAEYTYASYVNLNGHGYLDFSKNTSSSLVYNMENMDQIEKDLKAGLIACGGGAATGAVIGGVAALIWGIGVLNAWNPLGWAAVAGAASIEIIFATTLGAQIGGAIGCGAGFGESVISLTLDSTYEEILKAAEESVLTELDSEQYYEIRYYSPYYQITSGGSDVKNFSINHIKIVPITEKNDDVTPITPVGVS